VSLISVNDFIVVTYCNKWYRLSPSLVEVNGITLMGEPYRHDELELVLGHGHQ
jgi:hypothetical protein